jgi:hypothetical protein
MTEKRIIHNENRPAQPEPGEDPAAQIPAVREEAGDEVSPRVHERAQREERERQTGE